VPVSLLVSETREPSNTRTVTTSTHNGLNGEEGSLPWVDRPDYPSARPACRRAHPCGDQLSDVGIGQTAERVQSPTGDRWSASSASNGCFFKRAELPQPLDDPVQIRND